MKAKILIYCDRLARLTANLSLGERQFLHTQQKGSQILWLTYYYYIYTYYLQPIYAHLFPPTWVFNEVMKPYIFTGLWLLFLLLHLIFFVFAPPGWIRQNAGWWIVRPHLETLVFCMFARYILVTQTFVEHVHTPVWIVIPVQGYPNRGAANRHKEQHLTPQCFPSTVIHGILLFPFSISAQFSCTSTQPASFLILQSCR